MVAMGVLAVGLSGSVAGQQQEARTAAGCPLEPAQFHACAVPKMKAFNPPRTADGQPNMAGYWNRTVASQEIELHEAGFGRGAGPSFVLDTPNRKIPYQPWAMEFRKGMEERFVSPMAACYPPGVPRQVYSPGGSRIIQTPDHLVFLLEYSHSYRIIPTKAAAHPQLGNNVKLWMGQSRGHWEGNTLVVDVTNQNGLTWYDNAGNFYSDALHVTERYTLVDADTIHYEARIEDPKAYTRPWTMAFALVRDTEPDFQLYEQACVEGNRGGSLLNPALRPYRGAAPPRN